VLAAWPWLIALSVSGLLGYNLLLYTALKHTDAFNAALINAFNPALITLAAAAFLRERLTRRAVGGVLIALVGVLVVLSNGDVGKLLHAGFGTGELFMIDRCHRSVVRLHHHRTPGPAADWVLDLDCFFGRRRRAGNLEP
jgi:drug/metabolite transporter (DMT)-like permease